MPTPCCHQNHSAIVKLHPPQLAYHHQCDESSSHFFSVLISFSLQKNCSKVWLKPFSYLQTVKIKGENDLDWNNSSLWSSFESTLKAQLDSFGTQILNLCLSFITLLFKYTHTQAFLLWHCTYIHSPNVLLNDITPSFAPWNINCIHQTSMDKG